MAAANAIAAISRNAIAESAGGHDHRRRRCEDRMIGHDDSAITIPLMIGVTGHRKLRDADIAGLQAQVRAFFLDLQQRWCFRRWRKAATGWSRRSLSTSACA
jgi:hypothetical protein